MAESGQQSLKTTGLKDKNELLHLVIKLLTLDPASGCTCTQHHTGDTWI